MTEKQRIRANEITDQLATLKTLIRQKSLSDWLHVCITKEVRLRFGSWFGTASSIMDDKAVDTTTKDRILNVIEERITELENELENL